MALLKLEVTLWIVSSLICLSVASLEDKQVASARVESCKGCRLNRLPEVKKFIYEDIPTFEDVTFKPIPGATPELVLLNKFDQVLERIDLAPLSRKDCNDLLIDRGFRKKNEAYDIQRTEF